MGPHRNNHLIKRYDVFYTSKTIKDFINLALSGSKKEPEEESFGQLVVLGFDIAVFTPAPYQRRRLQRPSMEF